MKQVLTWQVSEPRHSLRTWVTLLSLCGRCFCPLKIPRMTLPNPERVMPPPLTLNMIIDLNHELIYELSQ